MKKLNLGVIRLDGETQARVSLDSQLVTQYAEAMGDGDAFPPIVVFHDGSDYWLADGFHRYHATKQQGYASIEAEIKIGTREEAQIYAFGANARRGLSTNAEDIRSIIIRMLKHPISSGWTLGEIARHVGVSKMTVSRVKSNLQPKEESTKKTYQRKDGKEVTIDTAKNKTKKTVAPKEEEPAPQPEQPQDERTTSAIAELMDTITELHAENQRLKDAIATAQWDASDIEKIDVQDTLADLREQIRVMEIDNAALRDSRDMFQNRNAELMKTVKSLQAKLKKLD
jgi:transcriptional regulator with XRE-family HTH domain